MTIEEMEDKLGKLRELLRQRDWLYRAEQSALNKENPCSFTLFLYGEPIARMHVGENPTSGVLYGLIQESLQNINKSIATLAEELNVKV